MSGFLTNASSSAFSVSISLADSTSLAPFLGSSISRIFMSSFMLPPAISGSGWMFFHTPGSLSRSLVDGSARGCRSSRTVRGHGAGDPPSKCPSVASVGVAPAPALQGGVGFAVVDDDVRDRRRAHGVIGVRAQPVEQFEILRAASATLEPRPSDVAYDCSPHGVASVQLRLPRLSVADLGSALAFVGCAGQAA